MLSTELKSAKVFRLRFYLIILCTRKLCNCLGDMKQFASLRNGVQPSQSDGYCLKNRNPSFRAPNLLIFLLITPRWRTNTLELIRRNPFLVNHGALCGVIQYPNDPSNVILCTTASLQIWVCYVYHSIFVDNYYKLSIQCFAEKTVGC